MIGIFAHPEYLSWLTGCWGLTPEQLNQFFRTVANDEGQQAA